MNQIQFGTVLLLLGQVCIGGWALLKLIEPANLLDMLRLFSMC